MLIEFVFKNGERVAMPCEKFSIEHDALGRASGYAAEGITCNKMLYWNADELLYIKRLLRDELLSEVNDGNTI